MEAIDSEVKVGIESFINEYQPVHLAYKYRYTDFVVHEIDTAGNLVKCEKEDLEGNIGSCHSLENEVA